jgi:hypothetical protein
MQGPKLKEDPREWRKFVLVMSLAVALMAWVLHRKRMLSDAAFYPWLSLAVVLAITGACFPSLYRGFYRTVMTASFHVGQVMGRVLLTLFFLVVVTPMGLLLRLFGKDLLGLKKAPPGASYWRPARSSCHFDRQF